MEDSIQARFLAQRDRWPDRRALGFIDRRADVTWRTWDEFFRRTAAYAQWLRKSGLRAGDVGLLVLHSDEHAATALAATIMLGAKPLLVAPATLQGTRSSLMDILVHMIKKTQAKVVVCDDTMMASGDELRAARSRTRILFGKPETEVADPPPDGWATPASSDVAALQLTSGTTGFPRVCIWKQDGVLAALDGMLPAMKLTTDDTCLNWTPLYHDMGLVNNFLLCLASGVPLVMMSPLDFVKNPALWLRGLMVTGSTHTWSPNFGYAITPRLARDEDLEGVRLDHVRAFWNAAERIHLETIFQFRDRFVDFGLDPKALKTNFGCAENVGGATFSDPDGMFLYERVDAMRLYRDRIATPTRDDRPGRSVPIVGAGRPVPGVELRVLSRTGDPLPDGHVGEVALVTPSRMVGYLKDAKSTKHAVFGKYLRTGDLAYLRGQEMFWVGRVRERITVRGKKLDPSDLEPVLFKIAGLRPGCFVAFGVDDTTLGTQRLVVISELRDTTGNEAERIRRDVKAGVMLDVGVEVSDVVLVPKGVLTKTSSGKRRHRHFRELYLAGELTDVAV